jgi:hypothetical protein
MSCYVAAVFICVQKVVLRVCCGHFCNGIPTPGFIASTLLLLLGVFPESGGKFFRLIYGANIWRLSVQSAFLGFDVLTG